MAEGTKRQQIVEAIRLLKVVKCVFPADVMNVQPTPPDGDRRLVRYSTQEAFVAVPRDGTTPLSIPVRPVVAIEAALPVRVVFTVDVLCSPLSAAFAVAEVPIGSLDAILNSFQFSPTVLTLDPDSVSLMCPLGVIGDVRSLAVHITEVALVPLCAGRYPLELVAAVVTLNNDARVSRVRFPSPVLRCPVPIAAPVAEVVAVGIARPALEGLTTGIAVNFFLSHARHVSQGLQVSHARLPH